MWVSYGPLYGPLLLDPVGLFDYSYNPFMQGKV